MGTRRLADGVCQPRRLAVVVVLRLAPSVSACEPTPEPKTDQLQPPRVRHQGPGRDRFGQFSADNGLGDRHPCGDRVRMPVQNKKMTGAVDCPAPARGRKMRVPFSGRTSSMRLLDLGCKGRVLLHCRIPTEACATACPTWPKRATKAASATLERSALANSAAGPRSGRDVDQKSARPKAMRRVTEVGSPETLGTGAPKAATNWFWPSLKPPPTTA